MLLTSTRPSATTSCNHKKRTRTHFRRPQPTRLQTPRAADESENTIGSDCPAKSRAKPVETATATCDLESTVFTNEPIVLRIGGFDKTTHTRRSIDAEYRQGTTTVGDQVAKGSLACLNVSSRGMSYCC